MLKLKYSKNFKKDTKKFEHQKTLMRALREVIEKLLKQEPLNEKHCHHLLSGNWLDHKECHIKPDVLLIYKLDTHNECLILERLGSHSELFK